ncbi:steroid 17-alpha-hydroxylase/17,20 lyase-like [Ruditapes philippinarum]|uniref:steroid 17-alpha-hydroxylase/17,20 lyase-like n=1 Tax=Ruditapes philippinarum TaxID=129788 RepID=UPI00295BD171|nr:steroid 17-alpha-hydroxylase/17,20 lyase-like [Ruditapes philippinarum]
MCFGEKYDFNDKEFSHLLKMEDVLIKKITEGVPEDFIPGLRYVYKSKAFKELEGLKDCLIEGFIRRKYKESESTFNKDDIRHFTDTLIFARMEAKKEEGMQALSALDEDHLIQTLAEIYFAGIDALRLTLEFALLHMVAFSDIQRKVQDEIANVVGKERLPGLADRPNLGYTEAVIHESMRLATIGPTGIFHESSCDSEICGYRIPKGTSVVINHWALHNDPSAWDDVDRFIPQRYLDEDCKLGPKPKSWLPFSAGTRVCLGEFVAKPILHLIFASLMQRYKWKMESGICPDINPVGTPFTLSCKPYKVIAEKRI